MKSGAVRKYDWGERCGWLDEGNDGEVLQSPYSCVTCYPHIPSKTTVSAFRPHYCLVNLYTIYHKLFRPASLLDMVLKRNFKFNDSMIMYNFFLGNNCVERILCDALSLCDDPLTWLYIKFECLFQPQRQEEACLINQRCCLAQLTQLTRFIHFYFAICYFYKTFSLNIYMRFCWLKIMLARNYYLSGVVFNMCYVINIV